MDFPEIIDRIKAGENLEQEALLPYLSSENLSDRISYNFQLAQALANIEKHDNAQHFIQRAWTLSKFSLDILPLYILIHQKIGDIFAIQQAYKRLGMLAANKSKISESIEYFNSSMYAHANYLKMDKYDYDYDILECIEKLARPYKFYPRRKKLISHNHKIKLAYLTYLSTLKTSVFYRINGSLARFHDKSKFEVVFFVPRPESEFDNAHETLNILREYQCSVVMTPPSYQLSDDEALIWIAQKIYQYSPDLLITNAGLADLRQYFIMSLTPALRLVNFLYASPVQYVSPKADWAITSAIHPLLDSPCNTSLIPLELDLNEHDKIHPCSKNDLGIPDDSVVIISAGRPVKFQNHDFWMMLIELSNIHKKLYFVIIGISQYQLPVKIPDDVNSRFKLIEWTDDYLSIVAIGDIVIDTYPSGGGFTLIDAMALGIPPVTFANDYLKLYDPVDWSVAEEFMNVSDLIIERGDFTSFSRQVSKLVGDSRSRRELGVKCQKLILNNRGKPERFVRAYEEIYEKLIITINKKDEKKIIQSFFYFINSSLFYSRYNFSKLLNTLQRKILNRLKNKFNLIINRT